MFYKCLSTQYIQKNVNDNIKWSRLIMIKSTKKNNNNLNYIKLYCWLSEKYRTLWHWTKKKIFKFCPEHFVEFTGKAIIATGLIIVHFIEVLASPSIVIRDSFDRSSGSIDIWSKEGKEELQCLYLLIYGPE